jgi:tetratricopeptide (TPR) repeat protein
MKETDPEKEVLILITTFEKRRKNIMRNTNRIIGLGNVFLLALTVLFINACGIGGIGGDISKVKKGYLDFDKSITIGQAFEGYKYFDKKNWSALKDEQGRRYVNYDAQMNKDFLTEVNNDREKDKINFGKKGPIGAIKITFQFTINHDGTFFPSGSGYVVTWLSGEEEDKGILNDSDVMSIYKNEPFKTYAFAGLGMDYERGKNLKTVDNYTKEIQLKPIYSNNYLMRADAYFKLGQYQLAIEDYTKAINLEEAKHGYTAHYYKGRADIYFKQGNNDLGCRDLQTGCERQRSFIRKDAPFPNTDECGALTKAKSEGICH